MKEKIIAKRYAEGFLRHIKTTIGFEHGLQELFELKTILRESPELKDFLENQGIGYAKKVLLIDAVLHDVFSDDLRNFIKLLIDKNRINQLVDIIDYCRVTYAHGEAHDALITTTYPLDLDVLQHIKTTFEKKINRKLNLYVELDPNLLGGVKVMIGHTVFDGSVQGRLHKLHEQLHALQLQ